MIRPPSVRRAAAAWMARKTPRTLMSSIRSRPSTLTVATSPRSKMPALTTSPDSSWLARSKAADCKPRQCAQTLSVAARTGGELNALHRHLQKGGGFADVDRGIDFSTCLPLTDAFDQAPEKLWARFASQHHKLRIRSPKFTDSADTQTPQCTYAIIVGDEANQKRFDTAER